MSFCIAFFVQQSKYNQCRGRDNWDKSAVKVGCKLSKCSLLDHEREERKVERVSEWISEVSE